MLAKLHAKIISLSTTGNIDIKSGSRKCPGHVKKHYTGGTLLQPGEKLEGSGLVLTTAGTDLVTVTEQRYMGS